MDNGQQIASNNPPVIQQYVPKGISCVVSKRVSRRGQPIRYMVRDQAVEAKDSGWAFFSGEELDADESFLEKDENFQIFELNTVINADPSIMPLLNSPVGSAFERDNPQLPWHGATDIPPEGPIPDPYVYRPPTNTGSVTTAPVSTQPIMEEGAEGTLKIDRSDGPSGPELPPPLV